MNFDNARNAQIEILRDLFGYEEHPGHGEGAEAFVDPGFDQIESQIAAPGIVAAVEASVSVMTRSAAKSATKPKAADSDHIAIGMAPKSGTADLKLVALYQRPGLQDTALMADLKERYGEEIVIRYGGRVRALQGWHFMQADPMRLGSSCGHRNITAGTLGCFAADRTTGALGILSNNHVLADVNAAQIGDEVLQPGPSDGGTLADRVARLSRFVPIRFQGVSNELDCAWAELDTGRGTDRSEIFDSAGINVGRLTQVQTVRFGLLEAVVKIGRTTGYTQGEITLTNVVNLNVDMGGPVARFDNVISIESLAKKPFSDGGDSGSLILNTLGQPGALLFAGSANGGAFNQGTTFACHLDSALNALDIDLVN